MPVPDHETRKPDVEFDFGHEPGAPRRARRALRPLLDPDGDPIAPAVESVASELVSNVVQHTVDGGTVRAWDPKPDLPFHLEVSDDDPTIPDQREAGADESGGRGLSIVDELSDAWGIEGRPDGKTIWADFNRPR